jgi:hypothetical protein
MKRRGVLVAAAFLAAGWVIGCSGADGGQSGTGIAAIRGNVVAAPGTQLELADIRVSLVETDLVGRTDAVGRFELRGQASGPAELRFERDRDGLLATTSVVVPAGGVLELSEIVLDPESDEAQPTMRRVEFEGFIETLDCAGGEILVTAKDDSGTVFTVEVASATIRDDDVLLTCADLQVGDRVQIDAETPDGLTLVNAEVILEDREDEPGDDSDDDSGVYEPGDGEVDDGDTDEGEVDDGEVDDDDTDEGEVDDGEADDDETDEGEADDGEADDDETDEGEVDDGEVGDETDEGEADDGEADGETDEGEADDGEADGDETDEGQVDDGEADEADDDQVDGET